MKRWWKVIKCIYSSPALNVKCLKFLLNLNNSMLCCVYTSSALNVKVVLPFVVAFFRLCIEYITNKQIISYYLAAIYSQTGVYLLQAA